jgi:AbiV family abortive infection protein
MSKSGVPVHIDSVSVRAMDACRDHARDLLASAQAVLAIGHHHIAYHLATLALEEIGKRELIGLQSISAGSVVPPEWPVKHTQDHMQKLFWCFFGAQILDSRMSPSKIDEMRNLARTIHFNRLAGLYVDRDEDGVSVPADAISPEEAQQIVKFAAASIDLAAGRKMRKDFKPEEIELQKWFLAVTEDGEKRRQIFSKASLDKLAELKDGLAWAEWLKSLFDQADADSLAAAQAEIERSRTLPGSAAAKDKWKLRIRLQTQSHSVRPKALKAWNDKSKWIKLSAVSGKKDEWFVEFIFPDHVPVDGLWYFAWGVARQFVVALNIGSMGFWWWRMPEQIDKFYEKLEDLESGPMVLRRNPVLKVDWGENRVLSEEDLSLVMSCFVALPGIDLRDQHGAYNHYIGGVTFLSLNDIHWQCESSIYKNFHECLKAMMKEGGDWRPDEPFEPVFLNFLDDFFPNFDERDWFQSICNAFESSKYDAAQITLKEASFIKLFCDAYFIRRVRPRALAM